MMSNLIQAELALFLVPTRSVGTHARTLCVLLRKNSTQSVEAGIPTQSVGTRNINAGTGADNVIPEALRLLFNFRYSTEVTHSELQEQVSALLDKQGFKYSLAWRHSGLPFITQPGDLITATQEAIYDVRGYETSLSTAGGTSDGRFIAPAGAEVVELGPNNSTIHKINECVSVEELDSLSIIYQRVLENLLI